MPQINMKNTLNLLIAAMIVLSLALSAAIALSPSDTRSKASDDEVIEIDQSEASSSWNAARDPYWSDYN